MLFEDLKKANMQAMKDHDAVTRGILAIVIGKVQLVVVEKRAKGEELADADVLTTINKTIKELDEEILAFSQAKRDEKVAELKAQRDVLAKYLPKMLTADEIRAEIAKLEDKSIPAVMKYFKANFAGQVDNKLVSQIAKENQ